MHDRAMDEPSVIPGIESPVDVLVTGASGGIGRACVMRLLASTQVRAVHAWSRRAGTALADLAAAHPGRLHLRDVDLADACALAQACEALCAGGARPQLVLHAAGVLHDADLAPERALAQVQADALARAFALNATAAILLARGLAPCLPREAPLVFAALSARVGSIGDNALGGWYAYRASKAALNQLMRTLAIEWRRTHPRACVLLLHPGTVDTGLSRPFQARVPPAQLFDADRAAGQLLARVAEATPAMSGRFLAWDGREVPW